jgi:hypothetical protein
LLHGDNGIGLGASYHMGWKGLVGKLIQLFGILDAHDLLEGGCDTAFAKVGSAGPK